MSEPARLRTAVELDEFERRLAAAHRSTDQSEDPLAELAKLMEAPVAETAQHLPKAHSLSVVPVIDNPQVGGSSAWDEDLERWEHELKAHGASGPIAARPASAPDFSAQIPIQQHYAHPEPGASTHEPQWQDGGLDRAYEPQAATRSHRNVYMMGGALVAIVAMIGGTFALRGTTAGLREPPVIKATAGPTKIQPESYAAADTSVRSSSVLDKSPEKLSGSRMVNSQEQPVDLMQQAARGADARRAAIGNGGATAISSLFPEPKRVRTVSVRPDGSIIGTAQNPAPAPAAAAATPMAAPAPTPRPVVTASVTPVAAAAAAPPLSATPAAQAAKPPAAKSTARVGAPIPLSQDTVASIAAPKVKPTSAIPAAVETTASAGAGGGFAVQLAAAGSDAEARDRISKFQSRFASELGGRRASVVKGDVNGKSVFRIRVVGLSKDDAATLCGNLKAAGGACFVAR